MRNACNACVREVPHFCCSVRIVACADVLNLGSVPAVVAEARHAGTLCTLHGANVTLTPCRRSWVWPSARG